MDKKFYNKPELKIVKMSPMLILQADSFEEGGGNASNSLSTSDLEEER